MQTLLLDATWYKNEFWAIAKTLITSGIGAYIAYRFAIWQKRKDNVIQIDKDKNALILKSMQECWKLLAYMSPTENEKSVFTFERDKDTKKDTYYFHKANAEAFMKDVATFFYGNGWGLFLPREAKPHLFKYRSQIFGILLSEKNNTDVKIVLKKEEMYKSCMETYRDLNEALRHYMGMENPSLPEE